MIIMKKCLFLMLLLFCSLSSFAQFTGGFGQADPNAWFDKEPYFWCQNQTYYQYSNVSIVINNDKVYALDGTWLSGGYIAIGKNNGIKFSSGDKVSIYIGNQCVGTWLYSKSSSTNLPRLKGSGKVMKKIWKYVKKLRK